MDSVKPKPRINASMLPRLHGQAVCLVGLAHSPEANGMSMQVTASDTQDVTVKMTEPLQEYIGGLVEIHGVVQPNNQILCHNYVIFSPENASDFDMPSYNKAIQLMSQFPEHYIVGSAPA